TENGNPMGWSLHTVPIQKAVEEGIVERINAKKSSSSSSLESREHFLKRIRSECIDEEQWLQEYCCQPADEASAFISYEMIVPCEADCMKDFGYLATCVNPLYLGVDFARTRNLTVMDVGEKLAMLSGTAFALNSTIRH